MTNNPVPFPCGERPEHTNTNVQRCCNVAFAARFNALLQRCRGALLTVAERVGQADPSAVVITGLDPVIHPFFKE
jgi:hypothetical protein